MSDFREIMEVRTLRDVIRYVEFFWWSSIEAKQRVKEIDDAKHREKLGNGEDE